MRSAEGVSAFKSSAWMTSRRAEKYERSTTRRQLGELQIAGYSAWLIEDLPAGSYVLDVGAGTGALSRSLAAEGFNVSAIDISPAMLARVPRSRRITTAVVDVLSGEIPTGPFDAIVSRWMLPHFPDWPTIIARLRPSLAASGAMYIDFPNPAHYSLAAKLNGSSPSDVGYAFGDESDPLQYYDAPTESRISEVATANGLRLSESRSASFLASNQLIGQSASQRIQQQFERRSARKLLRDLDRILAIALPPEMCPLSIHRLTPFGT